MLASRENLPPPPARAILKMDDPLSALDLGMQPLSKIQQNDSKRRFSDEQIKFLELMFESESRPELRTKQQVASQLGLEPRQVAIWFQNRRARLKTKQIERDYSKLKASYDTLATRVESLKRENQSLIIQLQELKSLQASQHGNRNFGLVQTESGSDGGSKIGRDTESNRQASFQLEGDQQKEWMLSKGQESREIETNVEKTGSLNPNESADGSMTSSERHSFESTCFLDESSCSSEWLEFLY